MAVSSKLGRFYTQRLVFLVNHRPGYGSHDKSSCKHMKHMKEARFSEKQMVDLVVRTRLMNVCDTVVIKDCMIESLAVVIYS